MPTAAEGRQAGHGQGCRRLGELFPGVWTCGEERFLCAVTEMKARIGKGGAGQEGRAEQGRNTGEEWKEGEREGGPPSLPGREGIR